MQKKILTTIFFLIFVLLFPVIPKPIKYQNNQKKSTSLQASGQENIDPEKRKDDFAFSLAKKEDTIDSYRWYLKQYPSGSHIQEARERIEQLEARYWEKWLRSFDEAVEQGEQTENDPRYSDKFKKEVWEGILKEFSEDNPYTSEDEILKDKVKQKVISWGQKITPGKNDAKVYYTAETDNFIKVAFLSKKFKARIDLKKAEGLFFEPELDFIEIQLLGLENIAAKKVELVIFFEQNLIKRHILSDSVDYLLFLGGKEYLLDKEKMKFYGKVLTIMIDLGE